jgi:hypothetical protein
MNSRAWSVWMTVFPGMSFLSTPDATAFPIISQVLFFISSVAIMELFGLGMLLKRRKA